ncbi:hypothetical protein [Paenibacillus polymyxa]|uniref:hypothetical protein n=1 Tax=Paenibacillus polymyxa TaxID=1406 RepID=UPI0001E6D53A|nr:hypothetical protein [Paenibacillus polymyxa]WDM22628.1 hypothetical protein J4I02_03125 [Paenibacillus polymyxa]WPQ59921.1 hypothetical protein SKN87_27145 [Paenibacillus polymyxa]
MEMTLARFTELLEEQVYELAKDMIEEHGLTKLKLEQNSICAEGKITIKLSEKGRG